MNIREQFNSDFRKEWCQPQYSVKFSDEGEKSLVEYLLIKREEFKKKTQSPLFRDICHQLKEKRMKFYLYYLEKFSDGYHYIPIYIPDIDTCIGFDHKIRFLRIGVTPEKELLYKENHKAAVVFEGTEKNVDIFRFLDINN